MEKREGMTNYCVDGCGQNSSDSCLIDVLWKKHVCYEFASYLVNLKGCNIFLTQFKT